MDRPVAAERPASTRGPNARWERPRGRNYLLEPSYRTVSLDDLEAMTEEQTVQYLATLRWPGVDIGKQVCPSCGSIESHYWCASISGWKCREKQCRKKFSLFSGTRVHGMKMPARKFLRLLFQFVEGKDGISSRELSGLNGLNYQTVHVLTLKVREAIRETMGAEEPLRGYVQADAAYFIKYIRPGNIGNGASLSARADQKNAGLDEDGKVPQTVNENMHALVVFVQSGQQGHRRYRVAMVKTENQVELLTLAQRFCEKDAIVVTDQHSAYNLFSGEFLEHFQVNHKTEFMTDDGFHTNQAEGVFSRLRAAIAGAWHRTSIQNLVEYGWEVCWRQTMVGRDNRAQLEDLLVRVLTSGRANRFGDYWGKRPKDQRPEREEVGEVVEVDKRNVAKARGRPKAGVVRMKSPRGKAASKANGRGKSASA